MRFRQLEKAGRLDIVYGGHPLDLYTFGVLNLNLHDVVDKVAIGLLSQEGLLEPTWKRPRYLPQRPPLPYQRIIRADVEKVQVGSLIETVTFAIAVILADPNVIAVLQNLSANIVWAISVSGVRGIQHRASSSPNNYRWYRRDSDPVEIGPNLRDVLVALAEHNDGHGAELRVVSRAPGRDETEVVLMIRSEE